MRAAHRVAQVDLAFDQIVPAGRVGVLEIRHVDIGAAIERVDHHLAVDRTGDFDAAVEQILGQRRHGPIRLADALGLRREIGPPAGIEPGLGLGPELQEPLALRAEFALEPGEEGHRLRRQDFLVAGLDRRLDLDALGLHLHLSRHEPPPDRKAASGHDGRQQPPLSEDLKDWPARPIVEMRRLPRRWGVPPVRDAAPAFQSAVPHQSFCLRVSGAVAPSAPG